MSPMLVPPGARPCCRAILALAAAAQLTAACGDGDGDATDGGSGGGGGAGPAPCTGVDRLAVVTDLDETLTVSDDEFLVQFGDASYDPAERPDACRMIAAWAARGYFVLYLTARPADLDMGATGLTSAQATLEWLDRHRCPLSDRTRATFAPELVFGDSARAYKVQALQDLAAEGFAFAYAYGNATSDADAYEAAGIPKASTFLIGEQAGYGGTVAVEGEGWTGHLEGFVEPAAAVCSP